MNMTVMRSLPVQDALPPRPDGFTGRLPTQGASTVPLTAVGEDFEALVPILVAAFRDHGHVGNVLTHISGARWDRVDEALRQILDPHANQRKLGLLAQNILDLLYANRGVTGRIAKPYFEELLFRILPSGAAAQLCAHVAYLFCELEAEASAQGKAP
ncbi:hypothetical protein [Oricola nitratireducens]|uniref:hypothetical protein n=1 Tax=Oricola nitratireducens TaxID=2775868 RepID=UPI001865C8C2|nr:hypothetical protein [Oricola nitratireducens]